MNELKELLSNPFVLVALILFLGIWVIMFIFFMWRTIGKIRDELDESSFRNE